MATTAKTFDWVTVSGDTTGGTWGVIVKENTSEQTRNKSIKFRGNTFTGASATLKVVQTGVTCSVGENDIVFPATNNGEKPYKTFNIVTNYKWTSDFDSESGKYFESNISSGGTGTIPISVACKQINSGTTEYSGSIVFYFGEATHTTYLTQLKPTKIKLSSPTATTMSFNANGEIKSQALTITGRYGETGMTISNPDWLTVTLSGTMSDNPTYRLVASENTGTSPRTGNVKFSMTHSGSTGEVTLSVNQPAKTISFVITQPTDNISYDDGDWTINYNYTGPEASDFQFNVNVSWAEIYYDLDTPNIIISANTGTTPRSFVLSGTAKNGSSIVATTTKTITQGGKPYITVNPSGYTSNTPFSASTTVNITYGNRPTTDTIVVEPV